MMNIQYIVYYHIDIHCTYTSRVLWEHVLCGVCSEMASEVVTVQPECQYMYCTCVAYCLWYVPIYVHVWFADYIGVSVSTVDC